MRLLFICSRARQRSPTAEAVFSRLRGIEALSAGTSPDAAIPVSLDLIEWAEILFVMETTHRRKLLTRFPVPLRDKRLIVLGIPDRFDAMAPELIRILESKVLPYLEGERGRLT